MDSGEKRLGELIVISTTLAEIQFFGSLEAKSLIHGEPTFGEVGDGTRRDDLEK